MTPNNEHAAGPHSSQPKIWIFGSAFLDPMLSLSRSARLPHRASTQMDGPHILRAQPIHAIGGGMLLGAEMTGRSDTAELSALGADLVSRPAWGTTGRLLHMACVEAMAWPAPWHRGHGLTVSVRLPAGGVCNRYIVPQAEAALDDSGLAPERLEIGLDERDMDRAGTNRLLALSALRDLGIGLALDCVGSTAVSLHRLRRLPLTCLRLDPGMVRHLEASRDARAALAEAVAIAHALDATVVATGVRTVRERDILADLGCDAAQGALFGLTMPAGAFRTALRWVG